MSITVTTKRRASIRGVNPNLDEHGKVVPTKTQQHFENEMNINTIVKRMLDKQGTIPLTPEEEGVWGDFTDIVSYQDAHEKVRKMDEVFMRLPSKIRNKFKNSRQKFMEFLFDPKNIEEAYELEILPPSEEYLRKKDSEKAAAARKAAEAAKQSAAQE